MSSLRSLKPSNLRTFSKPAKPNTDSKEKSQSNLPNADSKEKSKDKTDESKKKNKTDVLLTLQNADELLRTVNALPLEAGERILRCCEMVASAALSNYPDNTVIAAAVKKIEEINEKFLHAATEVSETLAKGALSKTGKEIKQIQSALIKNDLKSTHIERIAKILEEKPERFLVDGIILDKDKLNNEIMQIVAPVQLSAGQHDAIFSSLNALFDDFFLDATEKNNLRQPMGSSYLGNADFKSVEQAIGLLESVVQQLPEQLQSVASRNCYILKMASPPTQDTLSILPIPANAAAYIRCNNQLFYVDKMQHICTEVPISHYLSWFDTDIKPDDNTIKILTEQDLRQITRITGHAATRILVDQMKSLLKQAFDSQGPKPSFWMELEEMGFAKVSDNLLASGGFGYIYESTKKVKQCDHISISPPFTENAVDEILKLSLTSKPTYVRNGKQLFYVDQREMQCIELKLNDSQLAKYDEKITKLRSKTSSENDLKEITSITGHTPVRKYAVKTYRKDIPLKQRVQRKQGEFMAIAGSINHLNIALMETAVIDRFGRTIATVTPFIEGATLEQKTKELSSSAAWNIFRQVGLTIQALHEKGITHGDISDQNVMIQKGGRAILIDFGSSTLVGQPHPILESEGITDVLKYDVRKFGSMIFWTLEGEAPPRKHHDLSFRNITDPDLQEFIRKAVYFEKTPTMEELLSHRWWTKGIENEMKALKHHIGKSNHIIDYRLGADNKIEIAVKQDRDGNTMKETIAAIQALGIKVEKSGEFSLKISLEDLRNNTHLKQELKLESTQKLKS